MRWMRFFSRCGGIAVVTLALNASAQAAGMDFRVRCDWDHMVPGTQIGRNAWATKCGYLSEAERDFFNVRGIYVTFTEKVAPLDGQAPCEAGLTPIGYCAAAGCYTPTQRIIFSQHGYVSIEEAGRSSLDVVSGFADEWEPGVEILLVDEAIQDYTVGDQFGPVIIVKTESGRRVEVTDNHPLVNATGQVIQAKEIEAGKTQLLTIDGPEMVVSAESVAYTGKVWNIEPVSARTKANLHIAEGFISGSVRYQNEWMEDEFRRSLRNNLNLTIF